MYSPLSSLLNSKVKADSKQDFKLDNKKSTKARLSDLYLSDSYDGFMTADAHDSPPVRLASLFDKTKNSFKAHLNKREAKLEAHKARTMSYDVAGNRVTCHCCGKSEYSVLPAGDLKTHSLTHLCAKCSSALDKKQAYARTFNGSAQISDQDKNLVEYSCELGHTWTVNIHRAYKSWCSTCRKLLREEKKQRFREQSSFIRKENEKRQKEMFSEAQSLSESESSCHESASSAYTFEDLFQSILPVAEAKAKDFASPDSESPCTYEQSLIVYKVQELDETRAKFILDRMSKSSKKQGYKKLAIALHPDKNRHPLSKEAFQKASELLNST